MEQDPVTRAIKAAKKATIDPVEILAREIHRSRCYSKKHGGPCWGPLEEDYKEARERLGK